MGIFFKLQNELFVWPCNDVVQIDKTSIYSILRGTAQTDRSLYLYSIEQLSTVTLLCTVAKLVLS